MLFINWKHHKQYRDFGVIVGTVFLAISLWPLTKEQEPRLWLTGIAGFLLLAAVVWPNILAPIHYVWIKIGDGLGWINSRIILGIIFYTIFTPTGLIMRLFGKDPLHKKPDPDKESYWSIREQRDPQESMKYQF
ncbi:MAG: sxtJ [SAR324 cluster bacterium]|nr:sxtJ [SAR324 cluster bacterium]